MRYDETELVLVVDRSWSMNNGKDATEEGINGLLGKYRESGQKVRVTLVIFDTEYEVVYSGVDIKDVPPFELVPRGSTALLDAMGRAMTEVGERLKAMAEADRPGLVVFAVITDGEENSSREVDYDTLKKRVEEQQNTYKWQFVFLGADFDAFHQGGRMGVARSTTANYDKSKTKEAFEITGAKLMFASAQVGALGPAGPTGPQGPAGPIPELQYTDEERAALVDDGKEVQQVVGSSVGDTSRLKDADLK